MWKEEEHGIARVSAVRVTEARAVGAQTMAVACPFCMIMLTDAAKADGEMIKVVDVAEIIAERIK
jgi:Fe-S oxidoreductase